MTNLPPPPTWPEVLTLARRANPHYSMSEREQELLYELALTLPLNPLIVELGVCNGKTAIILASAAKALGGRYIGVDNWSLEGDLSEVYRLLLGVAEDTSFISLIQANTHTAPLPESPIDLLLIDAGHDEANVSVDCERWIPCIRPGGLVAFDDYPSETNWRESCHFAVRKHADLWTGDWQMLMFWNKVLVRRKPL